MKKLLFMIISMAACLTMSGQQINQQQNDYRRMHRGQEPCAFFLWTHCEFLYLFN